MAKKKQQKSKQDRRKEQREKRRPRLKRACGLCGATENLTKTECCGEWICDDEDQYVLFSYAHNSCHRNHRRYTLCAYHYSEGHEGDWITCEKCREDFEDDLEMYVYYGTNEYNFKFLSNPPKYEPTYCSECGDIIVKAMGGYSTGLDGVFCMKCTERRFGRV